MERLAIHKARASLRRELWGWQRAAAGLFAVSVAMNLLLNGVYTAEHKRDEAELSRLRQQLAHTEAVRDQAVRELGAMALSAANEQAARAEQAAAYEALGAWEYIGECTITAYCPCEACCGRWSDGVTATGLPAAPGVVAVDPDVISLGSTVIIDGQKYLAADTGVQGLHVDICCSSHQEAEAFGVRELAVWVMEQGDKP